MSGSGLLGSAAFHNQINVNIKLLLKQLQRLFSRQRLLKSLLSSGKSKGRNVEFMFDPDWKLKQ